MEKLGKKTGKLRKGGEANINAVAKQVIVDWQRGRVRYMVHPSKSQLEEAERKEKPVYNPALLVDLYKKGEDDELILEEDPNEVSDDVVSLDDKPELEAQEE